MKKLLITAFLSILCTVAVARDGLDGFLGDLNVQARADMPGFSINLRNQFGVTDVQVRAVLGSVSQPADAFMVFQLGVMSHQPVDRVLGVYRTNRGKGWGVIAKDLGIKPGSPEFHALKRGDFHLASASGAPRPNRGADHGAVRGAGRGNGDGNGNDNDSGQGNGKGHGNGHGKHNW